MNAGASPAGKRFATRNCDILFTRLSEPAHDAAEIAALKKLAADSGRNVDVFGSGAVVLRKTRKEAEDYLYWYAVEMADETAVNASMRSRESKQNVPSNVAASFRKRVAAGMGSFPLVGDADDIANSLKQLSDSGLLGIALSFVNYLDEVGPFIEEVIPRLERLGLRVPQKEMVGQL